MTDLTLDAESPRNSWALVGDWLYREGVVAGAHERFLVDHDWQVIQIPHDASVGRAFDWEKSNGANGWLPCGAGAYRKHFRLPAEAH